MAALLTYLNNKIDLNSIFSVWNKFTIIMDHALCHHGLYAQMEDYEVLLYSNDVE